MTTERDTYLLRAPKSDLDRWKNTARKRKVPFSQHIREALEMAEAPTKTSVAVTHVPSPTRAQRAEASARAREFKPDFKQGVVR